MAAGEPHGIRPFGLEPQRVLRLQKLHILVGQDTDAESNPLEAAMPWIVKFDKEEDFIGRWALEAVERAGQREHAGRLHASPTARSRARAPRWSPTASRSGRVTSSRFSPLLERTIGMAWVPASTGRGRHRDHARRRRAAAQRDGADGALLRPRPGAAARMSFEFLAPDAARCPRRRDARGRAARSSGRIATPAPGSATRAGWRVVAGYGDPSAEAAACRRSVGIADLSFLGKLELQGEPGRRRRDRRRARRRRRAGARAGGAGTTGSGGVRSAAERVLAVTPPEATGARARRARGGGRSAAGVRLGASS